MCYRKSIYYHKPVLDGDVHQTVVVLQWIVYTNMCLSFSFFPLGCVPNCFEIPDRWKLKFDDSSTKSAMVLRVSMPYPNITHPKLLIIALLIVFSTILKSGSRQHRACMSASHVNPHYHGGFGRIVIKLALSELYYFINSGTEFCIGVYTLLHVHDLLCFHNNIYSGEV